MGDVNSLITIYLNNTIYRIMAIIICPYLDLNRMVAIYSSSTLKCPKDYLVYIGYVVNDVATD